MFTLRRGDLRASGLWVRHPRGHPGTLDPRTPEKKSKTKMNSGFQLYHRALFHFITLWLRPLLDSPIIYLPPVALMN